MLWWVALLIYAASTVLTGLLQKAPNVKASSLGEMQVPTAEEGRNLPVIWGTCCLKAPNVVWYGDYRVKAIRKSMGWMSFGREYTAGHRYYLGMDLALCNGPVDALVDILAGTGEDLKSIRFGQSAGASGAMNISVNDPDAFGGEEKEGGIEGFGTFYPGNQTQGSDAYMSRRLGITYPAYRGVCHIVCGRDILSGTWLNSLLSGPWYLGTLQHIKNMAFVLRRCPNPLNIPAAQANINGDANPAMIIHECLQMKAWGLGFPAARFDIASFTSAAATLASEGFGMSLILDSPKAADEVIETVLRHIDGVCFTDPATGLWTLKLARPDYDHSTISEFTPDDIAECEMSRGSWEDTVNEVKVSYTDRTKWKEGMVQAQEPANFATRLGELATTTIDFSGFSNAATAQKACNRELRAASYPMIRGRCRINRRAWALRMGSPFRVTWPPLGIEGMAVRVLSIDYGNLTEGMMEIEFCEDIFSAAYTAFSAPPESGWTDPIRDPQPPVAQLAVESPHQMLNGMASARILVGAVRADGGEMGYQVWSNETGAYAQTSDIPQFMPSGVLTAAYPRTTAATDATGFTITSTMDLDNLTAANATERARGDNLLYFADTGEICAWGSIAINAGGDIVVGGIVRGVYDTLPADHATGTRVYFIRSGGVDYLMDYGTPQLDDGIVSSKSMNLKLLPYTARGVIDINSVSAMAMASTDRVSKPYPPGYVRINNNFWPNGATYAGTVTLTWAHRNRTVPVRYAVVAQDAGGASSPEGNYTVAVLIGGMVRRTQAGITTTSFAYTTAMRTADDADMTKPVQFRITPVNGSLSGTVRTTDQFYMQ